MRVLFDTFWVVCRALKGQNGVGARAIPRVPHVKEKYCIFIVLNSYKTISFLFFLTKDIYVQLCVFNLLKRSLQFSFYFI